MDLLQNQYVSILVAAALIGFIIYRQVRPRKLSVRGLVVIPVILLYFILHSLPVFHPDSKKIIEISITTLLSIVLGLLACHQLKVYASDTGKAMAKGSWTYFLWWLGAFVIKSILSVVFGETSFKNINPVEILIPVFLLIATRNAYLYWKVRKLGLSLH